MGPKPVYFSIQYGAPFGPAIGWAADGGDHWLRCGPFALPGYSLPATTRAELTSTHPDWRFRGCGSVSGDPMVRCGEWW